MLTTQNIYAPEVPEQPKPKSIISTVAERMAKMRAAKEAKKAQRLAGAPPTTTGVAPTALDAGTPSAVASQTTAELTVILRELQTMFGYHSPRGHELCAKALKLLEVQ